MEGRFLKDRVPAKRLLGEHLHRKTVYRRDGRDRGPHRKTTGIRKKTKPGLSASDVRWKDRVTELTGTRGAITPSPEFKILSNKLDKKLLHLLEVAPSKQDWKIIKAFSKTEIDKNIHLDTLNLFFVFSIFLYYWIYKKIIHNIWYGLSILLI